MDPSQQSEADNVVDTSAFLMNFFTARSLRFSEEMGAIAKKFR